MSPFGLAGPSYMTGAGSGRTVAEAARLRSTAGARTGCARLAAACASILLDSPRRLGASKMSKMGRSMAGLSSSTGSAMAVLLIPRRLTAAGSLFLATECCDVAIACLNEEETEDMELLRRGGGVGGPLKASHGAPFPQAGCIYWQACSGMTCIPLAVRFPCFD